MDVLINIFTEVYNRCHFIIGVFALLCSVFLDNFQTNSADIPLKTERKYTSVNNNYQKHACVMNGTCHCYSDRLQMFALRKHHKEFRPQSKDTTVTSAVTNIAEL